MLRVPSACNRLMVGAGDFGQDTREADARLERRFGGGYEWRPSSDPAFFPGRQAVVVVKGQVGDPWPCRQPRFVQHQGFKMVEPIAHALVGSRAQTLEAMLCCSA